jgi:glycosyltransferase involved in cell wall biosynthesis
LSNVKVSIIVPVYNVEKFLFRCINSLINQSLKEIEIILINDGSTDSSPRICDYFSSLDTRIKVLHKQNEGLGLARNSGLFLAVGEFVAFVDSDDFVDLKMYETLYFSATNLHLDILFCGYNRVVKNKIFQNSKSGVLKLFSNKCQIDYFLLDMIGTPPDYYDDRKYQMSTCIAIYSNHILKSNNIIFFSEKEFISEDLIFHIDVLQKVCKIGVLSDSFYFYCDNDDSTSLTKNYRNDRFLQYINLYHEICSRFPHKHIKIRANRLLIGYTRSLLFSLFTYRIPLSNKINIIKSFCYNEIFDSIYLNYDHHKLPFSTKIIFYMTKWKFIYLLLITSYLKNKFYK